MPLSRTSAKAGALLFTAVTTLSCIELTSSLPQYAEPMEVPAIYQSWWREVETCSGIRGRIEDVTFIRVAYEASFVYRGVEVSGLYELAPHRITLAGFYQDNGQLVRHEMLHALTRRLSHSNRLFLQKCGNVVSCEGACLDDISDTHEIPVDAVTVPAESLTLSVELPKSPHSRRRHDGWATMLVRVRNPYDYDIRIDTLGTHAFRAMMISGNGAWQDDEWIWTRRALHFRPHETKFAAFDLRVDVVSMTPPDTLLHEFRVAFGSQWSPTLSLTSVR